ncbi:MAG: threonine aldolase family protein, partial [Candidatus Latescibacteria bacterium]|nr:threonine aldolase family protein [Candidatus Latescibacterota bacterium]
MRSVEIDLYSDTATRPTQAMREFMCAAEVGDEQKGEDPSVNRLQQMAAELLGKEAALFVPSGTMCNQIAFAVHCRQGDVILLDRSAHPLHSEGGGASVLAGATPYPIDGVKGQFTAKQMVEEMPPADRYWPGVTLVSVEQTTNRPGGYIWPLEQIREVCEVAHSRGARTHMDGARLLNASVAAGIPAGEYAKTFESVWIDLSKGLGAPVGAVIASTAEFVEAAWLWKQRIGGAMRQAGIIAAAGIYALEHNVDRLAEDHRNAKRLASGITGTPGL